MRKKKRVYIKMASVSSEKSETSSCLDHEEKDIIKEQGLKKVPNWSRLGTMI